MSWGAGVRVRWERRRDGVSERESEREDREGEME